MGKIYILIILIAANLNAEVPELSPNQSVNYGVANVNLSIKIEPGFYSWSEISTSPTRADYSYMAQRSSLNLKVTEESWSANVKLDNIALSGVAGLPSPLSSLITRYPAPGSSFFLSQSYLSYQDPSDRWPLIFDVGIIPININNSLTLNDNDLGIMGAHANISPFPWLNLDLYSGNTENKSSNQSDKVLFHYANASFQRMGSWGIGAQSELDKTPRSLSLGTNTGYARRLYYLLTYDQRREHFDIETQIILCNGSYEIAGTPENTQIINRSSAYLLRGSFEAWLPRLEVLGPIDFGFIYVQGSGDESTTPEDEAFFAPLANKFNGIARTGWGEFLGATTYDVLSATNTWNGMPNGLSGVTTAGFSLTTKPHRVLSIPIEVSLAHHLYRATKSASLSKDLGAELALKANLTLTSRLHLMGKFFSFTPGQAYEMEGVKPESISGLQIISTLSFE